MDISYISNFIIIHFILFLTLFIRLFLLHNLKILINSKSNNYYITQADPQS